MMDRVFGRVGSFALAVLLSASMASCSGAASNPGTIPGGLPPSSAGKGRATVQFTIKVPTKQSTAASQTKVRPNYISPSTQSLSIALDGGIATNYSLTLGSPNCTAPGENSGLTCTIAEATASGRHTLVIDTFDQANGTGNLLSTNTLAITVSPGEVDTIPVVLNGVAVSLALELSNATMNIGIPSTAAQRRCVRCRRQSDPRTGSIPIRGYRVGQRRVGCDELGRNRRRKNHQRRRDSSAHRFHGCVDG